MYYRAEIDGLRAAAVCAVLLYHLGLPLGGFLGVDVFFTISGFLITSIVRAQLCQGVFSLGEFYRRRVWRLFPAVFVTGGMSLCVGVTMFDAEQRVNLAKSVVAAVLSFSNLFFYRQAGYFDLGAESKPLLHTWSLSVEEQFYLIWPALLMLCYKRLRPEFVPAVVAMLGFASLCAAENEISVRPSAAFYLPQFRACEFLLGAFLSWVTVPIPRPAAEICVMAGLIIMGAAVFVFTEDTRFPGTNALIPCFGAALVIVAGQTSQIARVALANRFIVFVGKISYSIYLVHWPVIVFMGWQSGDVRLEPGEMALVVIWTGVLAVILFRYVETRFRLGPKEWEVKGEMKSIMGRRGGIGVLLSACGGLVALSLAIVWFGGVSPLGEGQASVKMETEDSYRDMLGTLGDMFLDYPKEESSVLNVRDPELTQLQVGSADPEASDALIIGDSHASRVMVFAHFLGTKYNVRFHVSSYPGCSPLFGVKKIRKSVGVGQGRVTPENIERCKSLVEEWRSEIVRNNFSLVFLISRWSTSVEEGEYYTRGPLAEYRLVPLNAPEDGYIPDMDSSRALFATALKATAREIAGSARVMIMSEVPDIGRGSFQCKKWLDEASADPIGREELRKPRGRQPRLCTGATRSLALTRLQYTNQVVEDVAGGEERVEVIMPSKYFCDNYRQDMKHCRVIWRDKMLYRDSDHLSDYGSLYLALRWEADRTAFFPKGWKFT